MYIYKMYIKNNCSLCNNLKYLLNQYNYNKNEIQFLNIDTTDGLADYTYQFEGEIYNLPILYDTIEKRIILGNKNIIQYLKNKKIIKRR